MAGQNPTAFKDRHGFILDPTLEALWKTKATTLLHRILALLDSEGQAAMADKLRRGGYPGEEEFAYYTRFLGGDVLVTPMSERESFPVIHGYGPVQCEVWFVWSRDESSHASGHYILLRSWATLDARKCGWQRPNVPSTTTKQTVSTTRISSRPWCAQETCRQPKACRETRTITFLCWRQPWATSI